MKNYRSKAMLVTAISLALCAPAAAEIECGDFTIYYRQHDVYVEDRGEEGEGPADVRHGSAQLHDADDQPIGSFFWKATVMPRHADGLEDQPHPLLATGHTVLSNGTINWSGVADRSNIQGKNLPTRSFQYGVTGGTGVFSGAGGVMEAVTVEGEDRRTLNFTLMCPAG
ncbi:hypothetical protein [Ruegeria sp. A3M17]|uniref:hypothetical protein n=1 Tax=Ruegeria sp. A3M17 TaxID=2267229 RepID=UPI000DEBB9C6|nr:hypothetical protein [Ruegeria sp. A3M17]RBW60447.1 hypothetical protein DS906_06535 [Ruegeria sp. A3M17]